MLSKLRQNTQTPGELPGNPNETPRRLRSSAALGVLRRPAHHVQVERGDLDAGPGAAAPVERHGRAARTLGPPRARTARVSFRDESLTTTTGRSSSLDPSITMSLVKKQALEFCIFELKPFKWQM